MTTPEPTQPLAEEQRFELWKAFAGGDTPQYFAGFQDQHWTAGVDRLAAALAPMLDGEYERLRVENTAQAARLEEQRGATRVAAAAADRFRDVLSEALGHADENPGDDVLVAELRERFGFSGPEPTRWRDFLTGARAQIDQIEADRRALDQSGEGQGNG
jgi:hypothetical protein